MHLLNDKHCISPIIFCYTKVIYCMKYMLIVGKENWSQLIFVTILQLSIWLLLWSFALEMI